MRSLLVVLLLLAQQARAQDLLKLEIERWLKTTAEEEIDVVGRRRLLPPVVPLTAGGSMDVLSPERIHEATPTSVDEIANRLPGVSSRLYSGDEHLRPSISVRGMPDDGFTEYTAVLVDGINYSTLFYGWTALSIFPFTAERIWSAEVFRGAHALRYGPNTIGGVINFVTTPVPDGPMFRQRTLYGSNSYLSSHTQAGTWFDNRDMGFLFEVVQKSGDTFRDEAEFDVTEFAAKWRKQIDKDTWLQVNGFHWRDVHQTVNRLTRAQLDADREQNPSERRVQWSGWAYGADAVLHQDVDGGWWEAYAYGRKARRALPSGRPTTGPPYTSLRHADSDNYNVGIGGRGEFDIGERNRVNWGARYHQEWIDRMVFEVFDDGTPTSLTSDTLTRTHAFSFNVDDTFETGALLVTFGVRVEWIPESRGEDDVTGNAQEFDFFDVFPGVSANFKTSERTAIFANYHQSFRAPQTWAYDFTGLAQDFEFERGHNAELGFRWENVRSCSGSITVWYVKFSDFIEFDDVTEVFTNLGGFDTYGVDFSFETALKEWMEALEGFTAFHTVTFQSSEFAKGAFEGNETNHVPAIIYTGGVRYEHRCGFYGVFEGSFRDTMWVDPDNTLKSPGYWLFETRIGWRATRKLGDAKAELDIALAIKNLFDETVYLRHRADLYIPGAPREFFLSMNVRIDF